MGLQLKIVEARTPEEFARGFARLSEHGAQGVVLLADPSFIEHRALIAELARNARLRPPFNAGKTSTRAASWRTAQITTTSFARRPSTSIGS